MIFEILFNVLKMVIETAVEIIRMAVDIFRTLFIPGDDDL